MHINIILRVFLLILFFSSCRSPITYEATSPPEVQLADKQHNVLIINRHDTSALDINQEKKLAVYKEAFESFYSTLKSELSASQLFLTIGEEFITKANKKDPQLTEYDKNRLDKIYLPDIIMVIDEFSIDRIHEVAMIEDLSGYMSRTSYFGVVVSAKIILYDKEWQVIDQHHFGLEQPIDDEDIISGLFATEPSLGNQGDVIIPLSKEVARFYIDRFYPVPQLVTKGIYAGKHFHGLEKMIMNRQYKKATEFLLPLTKHENSKIADRAIYNLAIVKEAEGKFEEAKQLMELYRKRQQTY